MGQMASTLSTKPPKPHGKVEMKVTLLRNGRETVDETTMNKGKVQKSVVEQNSDIVTNVVAQDIDAPNTSTHNNPKLVPEVPPPSFPRILKKAHQERQFGKFMDILKQLHINIPLVKAVQQIPNYAKFMKDVLTKKRRLGEFETSVVTQEQVCYYKARYLKS